MLVTGSYNTQFSLSRGDLWLLKIGSYTFSNFMFFDRASFVLSYIPDGHLHRVTNTKCRTDAVISLNDGHIVA